MTDKALKPLFISRLPHFVQLQVSARFTEPLLVRKAHGVTSVANNTQTQVLRLVCLKLLLNP